LHQNWIGTREEEGRNEEEVWMLSDEGWCRSRVARARSCITIGSGGKEDRYGKNSCG